MSDRKRKLWIQITSAVLIVSLLASIVLVFADEFVLPEVTPQMEPIATPTPTPTPTPWGDAFTTPGNGEVQDHVDDGGSKEFYTVQTHNSNTFYIVIDKARMDDNVYMLAQVDEDDLMDFIKEPAPEETPEVVIGEEVEEIEEKGGSGWFWWVLLAVMAAAVGYWYFRVERPVQEETTNQAEDRPKEGLESGTGDEYEDLPEEDEDRKEETDTDKDAPENEDDADDEV